MVKPGFWLGRLKLHSMVVKDREWYWKLWILQVITSTAGFCFQRRSSLRLVRLGDFLSIDKSIHDQTKEKQFMPRPPKRGKWPSFAHSLTTILHSPLSMVLRLPCFLPGLLFRSVSMSRPIG